MFQREWHRMQAEGKLSSGDMGTVPDIYLRNQQLDDQLKDMGAEIEKMKQISAAAKGTWDKFRKERDFHKMHHKRVVQEKNKLILDLKRLKVMPHCPLHRHLLHASHPTRPSSSPQAHYEHYEPMLKMMQTKYEAAMKEKMLVKLERDRLALARRRPRGAAPPGRGRARRRGRRRRRRRRRRSRRGRAAAARPRRTARTRTSRWTFRRPRSSAGGSRRPFTPTRLGVADVAAHPTKPIVATASDDDPLASPSAVAIPHRAPPHPHPPASQARGRCSRSLKASCMSGAGPRTVSSVDFSPRGSRPCVPPGRATRR